MIFLFVILGGLYLVWLGNYLLLKTLKEVSVYRRIYFLATLFLSIGGGLVIGRTYWMIMHYDTLSEMAWSIFPVQRYYFSSERVVYHWLSTLPWFWWQFDQGIDYLMGIIGTLGFIYIFYVRVFNREIIFPRRDIMLFKQYMLSKILVLGPFLIITLSGIILFPVEQTIILLLAVGISLLMQFSVPKYMPLPIVLILFIHWWQAENIKILLLDILLIGTLIVIGKYWDKKNAFR